MNSSAPSINEDITGCEGTILVSNTTETRVVTVILIIVSIITAPVTSLLNGLVIIAVKTKIRLKTKSNIALACLATTDCCMGVIGQPIFVALNIVVLQQETSYTYCLIRQLSSAVLTVLARATILHLALMYLDRYIAIKHPYRYTNMVTATRLLRSSVFVWIVALLSTGTSFLTKNIPLSQLIKVSMIITSSGVAIIIFCQAALYYETRRHEKQITANQVSEDNKRKFLMEKKALKLTTTVLFFLVLSFSPLIVVTILIRISFIQSIHAARIAKKTAGFLILLNSLINPIIYCIRRRQFRVAFIEILFRKSIVQAKEIEMQVKRAQERLKWRGQTLEQENSLSTASQQLNTASTILAATRINTAMPPALLIPIVTINNIISDNEIDNSDNSLGSNNGNDNSHNNSDHIGIATGHTKSDNDVRNIENHNDNDSSDTNIGEMSK